MRVVRTIVICGAEARAELNYFLGAGHALLCIDCADRHVKQAFAQSLDRALHPASLRPTRGQALSFAYGSCVERQPWRREAQMNDQPDPKTRLLSKKLEALPIINRFLSRLQLDAALEEFVPSHDPRVRLPVSKGLGLLLRNLLLAREPLYGLSDWAARFEEAALGIPDGTARLLNDDRVGRCLDGLFAADRATLMTRVAVNAVRAFDLDMAELHNDSTTVTVTGEYAGANGQPRNGVPTHRIVRGHNKDHRPDLKQLLYILSTTADGAVPVWCSVEHGNTTDDQTHVDTWNALRRIAGRPDFLYVADSKLCTRENMGHIVSNGGRFVTVLPQSRAEDGWFREWIQTNEPDWTELLRKKNSRRQHGPDEVYKGFESPLPSSEGYRVLWVWSSQKDQKDRESRDRRIRHAADELELLKRRMSSPKSRLTTPAAVQAAADTLLAKTGAARWLDVAVTSTEHFTFKQARRGRPAKDTAYHRAVHQQPVLDWKVRDEVVRFDVRCDGLFPLIFNDKNLSIAQALKAYKHQPAIEKRHEQLKTVYEVMPLLLKSPSRIESFLFLYFLVLLLQALIERELRREMKAAEISALPLYFEARLCKAPTADRVFSLFGDVRAHALVNADGKVLQQFEDELSDIQRQLLRLLGIREAEYFGTARRGC